MIRDYKKIVAWQRAHLLTLEIYSQSKHFPRNERFGLTSQLRRAAFRAPSNIAEGSGRDTKKNYLRFLYIALGSLKETEYLLLLARDIGYLDRGQDEALTELVNGTFGALQRLIKAVKKEVGMLGRFNALVLSAIVVGMTRSGIA